MPVAARLILYTLGAAVVLTAVFAGLDRVFTGEPTGAGDVATDFFELLVLSAAMVASAVIVGRMRDLEGETGRLRGELAEAARAGRAWRKQSEHLFEGLSAAVVAQFDQWGLTEAEADIAALLLKGAAMKEIADLRRTSDATIRQQAQGIYRKSGLASRAELSAYFLEDLFDIAAARAALDSEQGRSRN